ncbi:hypothetical protein [Singulisphaera sp. PoT]|uniref:hypothetical protein n=1 Tax=Singulisphaera sp. PoT TaxID=3411797 RepID=UPI003BF5AA8B
MRQVELEDSLLPLVDRVIAADEAMYEIYCRYKEGDIRDAKVYRDWSREGDAANKRWVEAATELASMIPHRSGCFVRDGYIFIWNPMTEQSLRFIVKRPGIPWKSGAVAIPIKSHFKLNQVA